MHEDRDIAENYGTAVCAFAVGIVDIQQSVFVTIR